MYASLQTKEPYTMMFAHTTTIFIPKNNSGQYLDTLVINR